MEWPFNPSLRGRCRKTKDALAILRAAFLKIYLTEWRVGELPSDPECNETSLLLPAPRRARLSQRARGSVIQYCPQLNSRWPARKPRTGAFAPRASASSICPQTNCPGGSGARVAETCGVIRAKLGGAFVPTRTPCGRRLTPTRTPVCWWWRWLEWACGAAGSLRRVGIDRDTGLRLAAWVAKARRHGLSERLK